MSEYKSTPGPRGRKLYFKTNEEGKFKLISVKDIPEDILSTMEPQQAVDDTAPEFRKCIFCGQLATEQKWLNQEMVNLCLEDYQLKTTGEIIERLRQGVDNKQPVSNS